MNNFDFQHTTLNFHQIPVRENLNNFLQTTFHKFPQIGRYELLMYLLNSGKDFKKTWGGEERKWRERERVRERWRWSKIKMQNERKQQHNINKNKVL